MSASRVQGDFDHKERIVKDDEHSFVRGGGGGDSRKI